MLFQIQKKSTGCFCDIVMRLNEKNDKRIIIRLSSDDWSTKLIHIYYIWWHVSVFTVYPPRDILLCSMVTMLDLRLPPASISAAPAAGQLLLHSCSCLRRVAQLPGNCAAAAGGAKLSRVSAASRSMLTADLGIVVVIVVVVVISRPRSLVTSLVILIIM